MKIKNLECTGCKLCQPYCPVGAIKSSEDQGKPVSLIDQDECVECGACLRAEVCPKDAIYMPELKWPRTLREVFSNPLVRHPSTGAPGRGTSEMKTNDRTGRFRRGEAGISIEVGRPGIGATFRDIQTVSMTLAKVGIKFEPQNPVSALMVDKETGKINEDILDERVLSAIVEFKVKNDQLESALKAVKELSTKIDTVFSVDLISRIYPDGSIPTVPIAKKMGFSPSLNTKTNLGLGRPLRED
jgi:Pyruvate/2-oxoacid:ferredoxin oxidoreductase delta subunit